MFHSLSSVSNFLKSEYYVWSVLDKGNVTSENLKNFYLNETAI